mgnify:FL=1
MATAPKKTASGGKSGGSKTAASRSTGTGSGSRSSASRSRSGAARGGKSGKNAKRPIRREVTGLIYLLLALCVLVSYFTADGWLMVVFPFVLKGLTGFGYYLVAPALAAGAWILLTHKGRPVALRTACALLTPYLFGGVCHMLFCKLDFSSPDGVIPRLWESGQELYSGGVLSGGTAIGFMAVLGKTASVIVFLALLAALLMIVFQVTPGKLWALWKDRDRLDYRAEDYEDEDDDGFYEPISAPRKEEPAPRRRPKEKPQRSEIDIPLDGELEEREARRGGLKGFFKPREKMAPDEALTPESEADPFVQEPVREQPAGEQSKPPVFPDPEPIPPEPVQGTEKEAAAPARETPKRKKPAVAAGDVEAATAQVTAEIASGMAAEGEEYDFPPVTLLEPSSQDNYIEAGAELRLNAQRLGDTLRSFGVDATPGDVVRGPAITRYEYVLDQGVKLSKITNLSDDIALALGASGVRIAPIPEKISVVGIEVPNKSVSPVLIRDVIESRTFTRHKSPVAFAVGRDIGNQDIVGDIAKLPHVLIAGTTGSGKSVCTNSLIISLLYKSSPEDVRFIMVDPKMVELAPYNGIPHLLIPVVTDPKKAAGALQWAVYEMMKRYKTFSEVGVKKLEEYNALARNREDLPHMASVVVVIDELADLMLVAAKEVEESICRVAQMGRAAGMHLVIATQRPSSDVITGLMKANIPSRIAFAVASSLESRIILDATGAEKLVGRGDMLYAPLGSGKPIRVQGCYITPEEIERVVDYVKSTGEAQYSDEVMRKIEESMQEKEKKNGSAAPASSADDDRGDEDELLPAAVEVVLETGQASVSMLQRRLKLGYSRAARLVDQMEDRGIVGPFEGSKPRQLLITREKWQELQMAMNGGALPEEKAPWDDGEHVIPWEDQ